jgi:hypothetical protein
MLLLIVGVHHVQTIEVLTLLLVLITLLLLLKLIVLFVFIMFNYFFKCHHYCSICCFSLFKLNITPILALTCKLQFHWKQKVGGCKVSTKTFAF